ncbi:retrovirus-related pol polyprotein from transposon TNT 1-94, partial [Tanacetum coccineum]
PYAVSDSQISNVFFEIVPFPRRLHDYCYDEWKEARELKILETYSIGTTLHDDTLPQKEYDPGSFTLPCFIHNVCFDKALVDLGASVSVMSFSTYTNLDLGDLAHTRLTVELADRTIKHPRGIAENVLVRIGKFIFPIDFIILDIPEDDDVSLILGRPFLSTAHAKIDVFKRKITLRAVNESFDPYYGDYIELNDSDVPLEPRKIQDKNFKPTINENVFVNEPSSKYCYKMKFSCMIGYKHVNVDFLPTLSVNTMAKRFYNSIIKDEGDHEGKDLAETLIDIAIFIGDFFIILGFTIIDDMDETSDVVLDMPFCKNFVSCQKNREKFARRDKCERLMDE